MLTPNAMTPHTPQSSLSYPTIQLADTPPPPQYSLSNRGEILWQNANNDNHNNSVV